MALIDAANSFILGGLIQMEQLKGNKTFTWKAESFVCIPNTYNENIKTEMIGFDENADFRMTVRLNQFTPNIYPALNDYITYSGVNFLIREIKHMNDVAWVYVCEAPKLGLPQ